MNKFLFPAVFLVLFTAFFWIACNAPVQNEGDSTQKLKGEGYGETAEYFSSDSILSKQPFLQEILTKVNESLKQPVPVILMQDSLDNAQKQAQAIALQDGGFLKSVKDEKGRALRNEIFGIFPARESDYATRQLADICKNGGCYRVEMYNYALNLTTVALVNNPSGQVLSVYSLPHTQPDIPVYLKKIALKIATESPEVAKALGGKPEEGTALMADTKTALNRSRCERSMHLCVSPTFVKGEKALWTIVDLTDFRLVGLRWTYVGDAGPAPALTERKIQNEKLTECYCKKQTNLEQNGWKLNYMLTSSDGLRISEVVYKGKAVIQSAKLVDWHVSYSNTDGFGYSDAIGCPFFSTAAVVAVEPPKVLDLWENGVKTGFVLSQNFFSEGWPQPCNYNYQQRFEFYDDGRFRVSAASLGRGCGNDGTYRPVTRIAFAGDKLSFWEWGGDDWKKWEKEQYQLQKPNTPYTKEGFQYKIGNEANAYFVVPGNGQFKDGGRGDNAYTYLTVNHPDKDEGESDLITIGPCCNTDYRQGPEKFIEPNPEALNQGGLVMWYVPQIKNDDTKGKEYCWAESFIENGIYSTKIYPCFSGPMFVPVQGKF
ncbi:MAG: hypothetical protein K1X92_03675 [Bacteroidia bacterium]|nr:hypothetical protein [Bacteroidia bacterium]